MDENSQPVSGARVTALGSQGTETAAQLVTSPDGSFRFAGLAAGVYRVCVYVPSSELLNPCMWEAAPPSFSLAAGQQSTGVQIRLKRGQRLRLRVEDPSGVLAANEGTASGVHLLLGVWTSQGIFHPAPVILRDAGRREYSLAIPFETPLKLTVNARKLRLLDSAGRVVSDRDAPIALLPQRGEQQRLFQFRVAGLGN